MVKGALKWVVYLVAAALIILGGLFLMASFPPHENRLPVGLAFVAVAIVLLYFSREKKPIEIRQTVNVSGPLKVKAIYCPNCGASLDVQKMLVVDGRPFMSCDYCGHKFEVTEEPTW